MDFAGVSAIEQWTKHRETRLHRHGSMTSAPYLESGITWHFRPGRWDPEAQVWSMERT